MVLSTLRLEPLPADAELRAALACPRVIATSPAAVRAAAARPGWRSRPGQRWFVLGQGSARALRRAGVSATQIHLPRGGNDSEALLAAPALQDVDGAPIGLLTAPGGRDLLASALARRGARLQRANVYRRRAVAPSPARLRAVSTLPATTALLLTSAEAFAPLWDALDPAQRVRWQARPCLVASARLEAQARTLGFREIVRAASPAPSDLLDALAAHVRGRRFR